jgi:YebC/PmpR family DNA-binding regulatory protein
MSGHSHWATIRRKKGAQDAKRGQLFTKLAREIVIAAREGGGDPGTNISLQYAIEKARANNMPKDNIERAIRRGIGDDKEGGALEEINYEGYAPHGIALIISVVTDNRNRAVAEIRHILNRYGGTMAEAGSVAWQFTRSAYFSMPAEGHDPDQIFEVCVEAGAADVNIDDDFIEIYASVERFKSIIDALRDSKVKFDEAEIRMIPNSEVELTPDDTLQVMRVIDALEELDDVQQVFSTLNISDEAMAQIEIA